LPDAVAETTGVDRGRLFGKDPSHSTADLDSGRKLAARAEWMSEQTSQVDSGRWSD